MDKDVKYFASFEEMRAFKRGQVEHITPIIADEKVQNTAQKVENSEKKSEKTAKNVENKSEKKKSTTKKPTEKKVKK